MVLLVSFVAVHLALRTLSAFFALPHQARRWRLQQKERAMHGALTDALLLAHFAQARKAQGQLTALLTADPADAQRLLDEIAPIRVGGERDAAEREVDAGSQAHRGHDDAKLAGLGERFDDACACGVTEAAVMIGNPALEKFGKMFADDLLLLRGKLERIRRGQLPRKIGSELFRALAARREN